MKHLGDITKINGAAVEPVEVIIGGSPCQDLSVAGKREGLSGERSGLFMEQIRIIKEMREHDRQNGATYIRPRYMVWENVPGAFSSNKGEDFRIVLEETARVVEPTAVIPRPEKGKWTNAGAIVGDGWSIAWRVFDAQFWGVPQRRRRIALVADFAGWSAPKVLFESEGVSGYSAESFRTWQRATRSIEGSPAEAGIILNDQGGNRIDVTDDITMTLRAEAHHPPCVMEAAGFCTEHSAKARSIGYEEERSPTLRAGVVPAAVAIENHPTDSRVKLSDGGIVETLTSRMGTGGNNVPLVMNHPTKQKVFGICSKDSNSMKSDNPNSGFYEADTSRTLDGNGGNPSCNQGGMAVVAVEGNGSRPSHHGNGYSEENVSYTLNATEQHAVAYGIDRAAFNQGENAQYDFKVDDEGVNSTVVSKGPSAVCSQSNVRRLTPLECERLQGFPTVRKVEFTKMTKDEYIAFNINEGNIIVDAEKGKVYGTRGPGGKKLSEPKELVGTILNGYRVVSIRNGQTKLQCRVHRIVWISKNGIIPDGYVVDHINNNKQDNRISNLQILTPKENSTKARKDGLYKTHEEAGQAKITNDVHDLIQYVYGNSDMSLRQLAEVFKISKSRISQIIHESGWTDIGDYTDTNGKKRKTSDSARYKALGNSIALPSWAWLLERLNRYCRYHTMASLFDGIGGFPLIWETLNGSGSCIWASEIEEFPIAVTKYHFGERE